MFGSRCHGRNLDAHLPFVNVDAQGRESGEISLLGLLRGHFFAFLFAPGLERSPGEY